MVVQGLFDLGVFQTSWLVLWSEWYSDELIQPR
jgi:predicted thioesterase